MILFFWVYESSSMLMAELAMLAGSTEMPNAYGKIMFYYLSLGTNIQPEINAANMVRLLTEQFGPLITYPFVYTQPENIATKNDFLNSLCIIFAYMHETACKDKLNDIETQLGRNRDDPNRSLKDRTADIDILGSSTVQDTHFFSRFTECYIKSIYQLDNAQKLFTLPELSTRKCPTTVDFDRASGHVRVINDCADSLENWHKTTLKGQQSLG